jgi:NitT/TauT family transport system substrate-binding protein
MTADPRSIHPVKRSLLRAVALVAVFALLSSMAAACGDDDDADPTATPTGSLASTAVSGTTPAASPATGDLARVVVGYVPVLIYGPVILAEGKGYFAEYGLDVQLEPLPGGSDMVVLTANGDYDVGIGGAGPAYFNALDRGIELQIVAPLHFEREPHATPLVVSRARYDSGEITSVADLEGKKVSVNARGATEYWLDTALRGGGLTIADVDLQALPFPDVPAALDSGALDAGMLGEPLATRFEREGTIVRLDTELPQDFQPTFVWFNPDFAAENRELAVGFLAGFMRGCRDLRSDDWDSDENLAILNQYTNVEPDLIRDAARTYCEPNGQVDVEDLATLQQFFFDRELLEYDDLIDVATLVDQSYVEEALAIIGRSELE